MNNRTGTPYVVVRNNRVELRNTRFSGPIHLFAQGAHTAVMNGDVIIVTFSTGRVAEYRVTNSGNAVIQIKNL
jgi:hypothetical protein